MTSGRGLLGREPPSVPIMGFGEDISAHARKNAKSVSLTNKPTWWRSTIKWELQTRLAASSRARGDASCYADIRNFDSGAAHLLGDFRVGQFTQKLDREIWKVAKLAPSFA